MDNCASPEGFALVDVDPWIVFGFALLSSILCLWCAMPEKVEVPQTRWSADRSLVEHYLTDPVELVVELKERWERESKGKSFDKERKLRWLMKNIKKLVLTMTPLIWNYNCCCCNIPQKKKKESWSAMIVRGVSLFFLQPFSQNLYVVEQTVKVLKDEFLNAETDEFLEWGCQDIGLDLDDKSEGEWNLWTLLDDFYVYLAKQVTHFKWVKGFFQIIDRNFRAPSSDFALASRVRHELTNIFALMVFLAEEHQQSPEKTAIQKAARQILKRPPSIVRQTFKELEKEARHVESSGLKQVSENKPFSENTEEKDGDDAWKKALQNIDVAWMSDELFPAIVLPLAGLKDARQKSLINKSFVEVLVALEADISSRRQTNSVLLLIAFAGLVPLTGFSPKKFLPDCTFAPDLNWIPFFGELEWVQKLQIPGVLGCALETGYNYNPSNVGEVYSYFWMMFCAICLLLGTSEVARGRSLCFFQCFLIGVTIQATWYSEGIGRGNECWLQIPIPYWTLSLPCSYESACDHVTMSGFTNNLCTAPSQNFKTQVVFRFGGAAMSMLLASALLANQSVDLHAHKLTIVFALLTTPLLAFSFFYLPNDQFIGFGTAAWLFSSVFLISQVCAAMDIAYSWGNYLEVVATLMRNSKETAKEDEPFSIKKEVRTRQKKLNEVDDSPLKITYLFYEIIAGRSSNEYVAGVLFPRFDFVSMNFIYNAPFVVQSVCYGVLAMIGCITILYVCVLNRSWLPVLTLFGTSAAYVRHLRKYHVRSKELGQNFDSGNLLSFLFVLGFSVWMAVTAIYWAPESELGPYSRLEDIIRATKDLTWSDATLGFKSKADSVITVPDWLIVLDLTLCVGSMFVVGKWYEEVTSSGKQPSQTSKKESGEGPYDLFGRAKPVVIYVFHLFASMYIVSVVTFAPNWWTFSYRTVAALGTPLYYAYSLKLIEFREPAAAPGSAPPAEE